MPIKIYKTELHATPIYIGSHLAVCPVCGVGSNLYPCYDEGEGAAAPHRLTYCGHRLENNILEIMLPGIPKEIT